MLGGLHPGPHRPRHRPRRRAPTARRCSRCSATAARPPPDDFPAAARGAARLPRGRLPGRPPARAARAPAGRARSAPERLAARLVAAERDLGGRARAALLVRRLHQPRRRRERAPLPRAVPAVAAPGGSPRSSVAVAAICAETDEEAARLAASARMAFTLLRRGRLCRCPRSRRRSRSSTEPRRAPTRAAGGSSSGRRAPFAPVSSRCAELRRGRGDGRDDHVRPRGATPLVRAARGGVRLGFRG